MKRWAACLIEAIYAAPAQEFRLIWLQNCLADAELVQMVQPRFGACATNVFSFANMRHCRKHAVSKSLIGWMKKARDT